MATHVDVDSLSYRLRQLHDVGIFKDTLAPSIVFHSCFSVAAWAAGRATDRVDAKDWLYAFDLSCVVKAVLNTNALVIGGQLTWSATHGGPL